jgi:hypothetical protein
MIMKTEWLILADSAQIVGGKLYLLGGGWDTLTVSSPFPVSRRCAVAASFSVPWNETNEKQNVEIEIVSEDGKELARMTGEIEVGRPAGTLPGSQQRAQLAADMMLEFKEAGLFAIVARVAGEEQARTSFRVTNSAHARR